MDLFSVTGTKEKGWGNYIFDVEVAFDFHYPNDPPRIKFIGDRPFHPQIYMNNRPEFDLQNGWKPHKVVKDVLKDLLNFLDQPIASKGSHLIYPDAWNLLKEDETKYWKEVVERGT